MSTENAATPAMQPPIYSIVVPTRNREPYLPFALDSVLQTGRSDIEVVVSNNHSSDGTASFLAGLTDRRVRVVMPPVELPMAAHYEFALSQARGEWVTLLGDDDAVMPYIFDRLDQWRIGFPQAAIISSARAYYFWPGSEDLYGERVMEYDPGRRTAAMRSTRFDLLSALAGLRSCFDMPQIYTTCLVRRDLVERIRQRSGGRFYHSIIPDMYSAVAMSLEASTYLRVDEPLFWTGTSNRSMGRSDRIYKDAALAAQRPGDVASGPAALHPDIPQALHILGFESLYLYEALLQSPLATPLWTGRFVASMAYASLWARAGAFATLRNVDVDDLRQQILAAAGVRGVSAIQIRFVASAIWLIRAGRALVRMPSRLVRKLRGGGTDAERLVSTRHDELPTILDASSLVVAWNQRRQ